MRCCPIRFLALALLVLDACGSPASTSPPVKSPSAEVLTDTVPGQADSRAAGRLVGRWGPTLPRGQARSVALARWALADPPREAEFEAMGPSEDERATFRSLVKLKTTEPDSSWLADVRKKLADYEAMLVVITPEQITFATAEGQTRQRYRVVDAQGDSLTLDTGSERLEVRFLDADHISMRSDQTLLLTRDQATGYNDKDLRGELPAGLGVPPRAETPSAAPPASNDACSAYADCIDQMPQQAGDQAVMLGSASTIRTWERTPDRLRQCASALELARKIGLCR